MFVVLNLRLNSLCLLWLFFLSYSNVLLTMYSEMNKEPRMAWIHAHQTKIKKASHNESKSQISGGYENDDDGDGDGIGADNGK